MTDILRRLSVRAKLGLISATILLAFSVGLGVLYGNIRSNVLAEIETELQGTTQMITNMVETAADVSIKNYLRALAETNVEILSKLHSGVIHQGLDQAKAQEEARKILRSQPVADTGYIYCVNSQGTVTMHPHPSVQGKDVSESAFVRDQMQRKQGFLEYEWKNPGERQARAKVMYMAYFEPWDWIVSVTAYKNEFSSLISVEDFRKRIESIQLGKSGYSYIVSDDGEVIIHPFLKGNLFEVDHAEGLRLLEALSEQTSGRLTYQWRNPDEILSREKVVFFNRIPEYGWIVCSSGYLDEFYAPLTKMRNLILISLCLVLLLTLPLVLIISRNITLPLEQLTQALTSCNPDQGQMARVQWESTDEIGSLAKHFNGFMENIEEATQALAKEAEEREQAEKELQIYKRIFESAMEGISLTTPDGTIVAINPAFTAITGYTEEDILGQPSSLLRSEKHSDEFFAQLWQSLQSKGSWAGEIWNRKKDGGTYPEWLSISGILDESGETTHYVAVFHDISAIKDHEKQIRFLAYHDPLTSLPNRTLLLQHLEQAINRTQSRQEELAILYLDLDNFKNVNDSVGHALGDAMLLEFVERIQAVVRETDTLARLGGDEFVIIAEELEEENTPLTLAERIMGCLETPFRLMGRQFYATASMGITLYPQDGTTPGELIKNADLAMYRAKDSGKNRYHRYTRELNALVTKRIQMEADLRTALEQDRITVHFQPRVALPDGNTTGVEALARWELPSGGMVSPGEFIPIAEETGLIIPLGLVVLEKSLNQIQTLHQAGQDLYLSVNLSPKQFQQPDLVESVDAVLRKTGFPANRLEFEITETLIMKHLETSLGNLHRLSRRGIRLAIDDFGTGYSSLYYLKRLPIDVLKVDRSFVQDVEDDPSDAKLVETIILLAKNFGLRLVAEGVETQGQLDFLNALHCDEIQGYLFSKPLPFEALRQYLEQDGATT